MGMGQRIRDKDSFWGRGHHLCHTDTIFKFFFFFFLPFIPSTVQFICSETGIVNQSEIRPLNMIDILHVVPLEPIQRAMIKKALAG